MADVIPFRKPRGLPEVLAEIPEAEHAWKQSWFTRREPSCLDRLHALQCEARAMIEAATGVAWSDIEGANL